MKFLLLTFFACGIFTLTLAQHYPSCPCVSDEDCGNNINYSQCSTDFTIPGLDYCYPPTGQCGMCRNDTDCPYASGALPTAKYCVWHDYYYVALSLCVECTSEHPCSDGKECISNFCF